MKSKSDPRHAARELALSALFCWLFSEPNHDSCLILSRELLEAENPDVDLTNIIVDGVKNHRKEIDQIVEQCAPDWPLDKISKVDLVILRIAIFEILYSKNVQ